MKALRCAAVIAAQALSAAASAQDCGQMENQLQTNQCVAAAYAKTDAALNAAYRQIVARLADDPEGKQRLTAAQRAWLAFRDADCAFVAGPTEGGSIQPMIVSYCLDSLTRDRLARLETWLACQEGDVSCPVPAP